MRVVVINTGTEILLGDVLNTHLTFIAREIFPLRLRIERQLSVPDGAAIREVLHDVAENGMTSEEIARAKGAVKGSLVLSQEDSGSRMSNIGKSEIVYGEVLSFDEILKKISEVTPVAVRQLAGEILLQRPTLALVGPFKSEAKFEKVLGV